MRAAKREREKGEKELQLKREALEKLKMQEEQGRAELDSKYRATINQLKDREIDIESTGNLGSQFEYIVTCFVIDFVSVNQSLSIFVSSGKLLEQMCRTM